MFKKLFSAFGHVALGLSVVSAVLSTPSFAASSEKRTFDPQLTCTQMLRDHAEKGVFWALGFRAHAQGNVEYVSRDAYSLTLGEIRTACTVLPEAKFSALVMQLYGAVQPGSSDEPELGSTSDDISIIKQSLTDMFAAPDLDLVALLRELRPELADISAVFPQEMAQNLMEEFVEAFGPSLDDAEFPSEQPTFSINFSTTFGLKSSSFAKDMSGSYENIVDLFLRDVPFAQVQMYYPTIGKPQDIDGFYFVNNHWVVIPRPWRGLNQ